VMTITLSKYMCDSFGQGEAMTALVATNCASVLLFTFATSVDLH